MLEHPLHGASAKRLIRKIIASGTVRWTEHALKRVSERGLTTVDCVNALRAGAVGPAELEGRTWRYPVQAGRTTVVVVLRSKRALTVITAWQSR